MNTSVDDLFNGGVFNPDAISPEVLFSVLAGVALVIVLIIYLHHRYTKYKKERVFYEEMEMLEMDDTESNTLTDIVKRYALNEPVEILYSLRLFDEMAEQEMERVLSKPLPIELKKKYVNLLYNIRQKTYFPEGMRSSTPNPVTTEEMAQPQQEINQPTTP